MDMTRMHVHIDRLTLEGKAMPDGRRIVQAIGRHLTALANSTETTRGGARTIAHAASPDAIGKQIAAQVFQKTRGLRHV
jgi:hypothetical protein